MYSYKMTLVNNILVIAVILRSTIAAQVTAECTSGEYIISRNESITPPNLVEASGSTEIISAPPANVLYFGYNGDDLQTWCTDTNDNNPYVTIHFTVPVIITSFLSSGSTDFAFSVLDTFHLTNFTLEYTDSESGGEFVYFSPSPGGGEIKYFYQSEPVVLFQLEHPIITQAVRFRPLEWYDSETTIFQYICLGVALFGCTASEGATATSSEIAESTTTNRLSTVLVPISTTKLQTSTSTVHTTTVDIFPSSRYTTKLHSTANTVNTTTVDIYPSPTYTPKVNASTAERFIVRDYQVLEIALPIALLTTIINVLIVVVGVLLCARGRRQLQGRPHQYDIPLDSSLAPLSPGVKMLDNSTLYSNPNTRGETLRSFHNELYGEDSGTNRAEADNLEVVYSDSQYEYISAPGNGDCDSMVDNVVYLESSVQGKETAVGTPTIPKKGDFPLERNNSYGALDYDHSVENVYEETVN